MHDPMTVAFAIKRPWPGRYPDGNRYWPTLVTIWHVDPEKGGSDDSCGWSHPRLSDFQRSRLQSLAWNEARDPYYLKRSGRKWAGTRHEAEAMYRGLILCVARAIDVEVRYDFAAALAARAIHFPDCTDAADMFCFEPGYHTNFKKDMKDEREQYFMGIVCSIARGILAANRPWYRHPRWHLWHWKIQIHSLQNFKRWAFSRCEYCGGRFCYGESPCTFSWNGTGPLWFRSEKSVHHSGCSRKSDAVKIPEVVSAR